MWDNSIYKTLASCQISIDDDQSQNCTSLGCIKLAIGIQASFITILLLILVREAVPNSDQFKVLQNH